MMDEREKYSASALKLEQIPHVEATTEHLKANLNSSAPCARPPGSSRLLENLNRIEQKRTHFSRASRSQTNRGLRKWPARRVSTFQVKNGVRHLLFGGSQSNKLFSLSFTADQPLRDTRGFMKLGAVWTLPSSRNDDDSVLCASGKSPEC